jgi:hypothetical protein
MHITMSAENEAKMWDEQSYEMYTDWDSLTVGGATLTGGRMRPRGQSTLAIGTCLGIDGIPFLLDFTSQDNSQRLFGVEKMYLRHHMSDPSFTREWSFHRLLARSGLPYLRTRTVVLYINGDKAGVYEAMEAPDQECVRAKRAQRRARPPEDRQGHQSQGCGRSGLQEGLSQRRARPPKNKSTKATPSRLRQKRLREVLSGGDPPNPPFSACTWAVYGRPN